MARSKKRCAWPGEDPLYVAYHDSEWGVPVHDDRLLFEFLVLEGAQAGLSWITILRKRPNFRAAFAGFDIDRVARFGARDVDVVAVGRVPDVELVGDFTAHSPAAIFRSVR